MAFAIVAGSFYLAQKSDPTINLRWAGKIDDLMCFVSMAAILFISLRLFSWKGYRDKLSEDYKIGVGISWCSSELLMIVIIGVARYAFLFWNPLKQ